jgi:hypothetical protein
MIITEVWKVKKDCIMNEAIDYNRKCKTVLVAFKSKRVGGLIVSPGIISAILIIVQLWCGFHGEYDMLMDEFD